MLLVFVYHSSYVYLNQDILNTNTADKTSIKHVCYDMGVIYYKKKSESVALHDSVRDVSCQNCKCKRLIYKPHTLYLSGLEALMLLEENYFWAYQRVVKSEKI